MFKKILLCLFMLNLMACATPQENMNIEPAVIITKAQPAYPPAAKGDNIEGYVWVSYTVTEKGVVISPVVIESSPKVVFDNSALLAMYQFKYLPRKVNGKPTSITGMRYRFDFSL